MQYRQPAERLATWEISRLSLRSTLPSGSQSAALIWVKARTISGLRCMISTLLGTKPMRLRAASNCSFRSGACSGGSGVRWGAGLVRWSMDTSRSGSMSGRANSSTGAYQRSTREPTAQPSTVTPAIARLVPCGDEERRIVRAVHGIENCRQGAILLAIGLATRFAAIALLIMTLIIQIFVYPDAWPTHGTWAACFLVLIARGPGFLSLDHMVARRYGKFESCPPVGPRRVRIARQPHNAYLDLAERHRRGGVAAAGRRPDIGPAACTDPMSAARQHVCCCRTGGDRNG